MTKPIDWPPIPKLRKSHQERKAERIAKRFPRVTPEMLQQCADTEETIAGLSKRLADLRARLTGVP